MNCLKKKMTALKIEYHYAEIKRLTKKLAKSSLARKRALKGEINLHKLDAEKLLTRYEIAEGLIDLKGRFIA